MIYKTNLTPEEQIKKILAEVGKLNRRRNVVYDEIMEELEEYEKRTLNRFMKKLTVPGEKCNLKMRMNLRYACFKFLGM